MSQDVSLSIKYLYPNAEFIYEIYPDDETPELTFDERLRWFSSDIPKPTYEELVEVLPQVISEQKLKYLRNERNVLLRETDWWAVSDRTMTSEQEAYRQALRDITNTYSSLDDVVWPVKPE